MKHQNGLMIQHLSSTNEEPTLNFKYRTIKEFSNRSHGNAERVSMSIRTNFRVETKDFYGVRTQLATLLETPTIILVLSLHRIQRMFCMIKMKMDGIHHLRIESTLMSIIKQLLFLEQLFFTQKISMRNPFIKIVLD